FTRSVTQAGFALQDPLGSAIGFGSTVSGAFTFDSASPDEIADAQQGAFVSPGRPYGLQISIAGVVCESLEVTVNTLHPTRSEYCVPGCSDGAVAVPEPNTGVLTSIGLGLITFGRPPHDASALPRKMRRP